MQPSRAAAAARARSLALLRQLCTWTLRLKSGGRVATLVALERDLDALRALLLEEYGHKHNLKLL